MATCVLIIEDDEAIQEMVSTALMFAGFDAIKAPNGNVALKLVDQYKPDLIYLDMHMPVMDGWDFLSVYRATRRPDVPIIAVSAQYFDQRPIPKVAAYLTKPFDLNRLVSVMKRLLERYARV